ncbi:MAG: GAF domain-containing protein [Planctomycetota bacterium]|nr:GAF domain-containing protein [Planctomycetota bacterium]
MADTVGAKERREGIEEENRRLRLLMETSRLLATERNLDLLIGLIVERTTEILSADRSSVFLFDRERGELYSFVAQGLDSTEIRFPASSGLAGYVARTGQTLNIPDAYEDPRFNREIDRQTGYRTKSVLCMPMRNTRGEILGVIQALNRKGAGGAIVPFPKEDESFLENLANQAAIFVENARLYRELDGVFEAFVAAAARSIDDRDPCTSGHSRRVTAYALNLARAVHRCRTGPYAGIEYTRARLRRLRYAGMMHDFGKIGVREHILCKENKLSAPQMAAVRERFLRRREEILREAYAEAARRREPDPDAFALREAGIRLKALEEGLALIEKLNAPGRVSDEQIEGLRALKSDGMLSDAEYENLSVRTGNLTPKEWEDMRSHVRKTYEILNEMPWPEELKDLPKVAAEHHEKLDGSGYPRGSKGEGISLDGRILAIADIYDALTATDRPYKRAIPHDKAREIIEEEAAAGRLDGALVKLFFEEKACEIGGDRAAGGTGPDTKTLVKAEREAAGGRNSGRLPV